MKGAGGTHGHGALEWVSELRWGGDNFLGKHGDPAILFLCFPRENFRTFVLLL